MNDSKDIDNNQRCNDIRSGYQSALNLAIYEGRLTWQTTSVFAKFAALLIVASVSPAFVHSADPRLISILGFVFSVVGVFATLMWWSMLSRNRKYYKYWFQSARELERYLCNEVNTVTRGMTLADGDSVSADNEQIKFKTIERIRMTSNLNLFYGTFTASFIFLMAMNIYKIIKAF